MARNSVRQDEDIQKHSKIEITKRLLKYLGPYKLKVFFVLFLLIFVMLVGILNPYLLKIAIDKYISNNDLRGLLLIGLAMLILNYLAFLASRKRIKTMASVTNNIMVNIRHELYSHIQKLSFSFFDNRPVGKVLARVIGDVNAYKVI